MRPTRTAAIGPWNGMSETCSAADAPVSAMTSGSFSLSCDSTVAMTCVSQHEAVGKQRADGPIDQPRGEDFLLGGRPSRLKNPPGILPAANVRSW